MIEIYFDFGEFNHQLIETDFELSHREGPSSSDQFNPGIFFMFAEDLVSFFF